MIHFGDICKMDGAKIPVVDIITFGAPCQDLSVAGNRKGMLSESRGDAETTRSGLFFEAIRIIKEMRENDRRAGRTGFMVRPRFAVYENVPGAFSSNKGKDFQAVLSEIVKIAEPDAPDVPLPDKGKWSHSGCLYDELGRWSVAWRLHDAQFWGVPQRRKRIALVADFGGLSAPEILFEREGLSRDSESCGTEREGTAGGSGGCAYPTVARALTQRYDGSPCIDRGPNIVYGVAFAQNQRDEVRDLNDVAGALSAEPGMKQQTFICLNAQGGSVMSVSEDVTATLRAQDHGHPPLVTAAGFDGSMGAKAGNIGYAEEQAPTLNAGKEMHVYDARGNGDGEIAPTMTGDHQNRVTDYTALCVGNGQLNQMSMSEQANTLDTMHDQQAVMIAAVDCRNGTENPQINGTLQAKSTGGIGVNFQNVCRVEQTVRRLTPLECERLQGYPDGWTDIGEWVDSKGKKHKEADSPRYKALGNSIALPFWAWMARRICAQYERPMTMGSLFDGIGGFPLVFERAGAKAVWASEIEEFCVAVTKRHFPEEVQP